MMCLLAAVYKKPCFKRIAFFAACFVLDTVSLASQGTPPPAAPPLYRRSAAAEPVLDAPCAHPRGYEVLSDTQNVDFSPYIKEVLKTIRDLWVSGLPPEAKPPTSVPGWSVVRFTIGRDGQLAAIHLDASTHTSSLDKAAWSAITKVGSFPSFPGAFRGPVLELRVAFCVNQPAHTTPS